MIDALFVEVQEALKGRYSLQAELGRGGMGVVYLAHEVALDRAVALKVLPPEFAALEGRRERFLREARAAAHLSHPNIVPIHTVDDAGRFAWFAMAYIEGETLAARVQARGPMPPLEVAALVRDVARALGYAHARGIVHRDVKPDNILIERGSRRPMIADFGIARLAEGTSDTSSGAVIGTPEYMSPEQASGESVDGRSDPYALAGVAYFALAGRPPFVALESRALMAKQISEAPPSLAALVPGIPVSLARPIERCLAKAREERPGAGEELAEALDAALERPRQLPAPLEQWVRSVDQLRFRHVLIAPALLWPILDSLSGLTDVLFGVKLNQPQGLYLALVMVAPFGVYAAYRLFETRQARLAGFDLADLRAALKSELVRRGEEQREQERERGPAPVRRIGESIPGLVVAAIGVATVWKCYNPSEAGVEGLLFPGWVAMAGALMAGRALLMGRGSAELLDLDARERIWGGWLGRLAAKVAGLGASRRALPPAAATHRPTELALGGAAAALFDALPRELRVELRGVPDLIAQLERHAGQVRERMADLDRMRGEAAAGRGAESAVAARRQLEEELRAARSSAERRLTDVVTALETVRLNLIRLRAGTASPTSISADLDAARRIGADIDAAVAARSSAERLLRPMESEGR